MSRPFPASLIPFVFFNFYAAFRALAQGRIAAHRRFMQGTYFGACIGAGLFALIPVRYLGNLLWHTLLRLM
jgi:uncharacterized membrane protein